jgi:RNA chaperone ProQ/FINO-like protein
MARATTKLLERLAQQQQQRVQQQRSQPTPQPGTNTAPLVTTAQLAPAQGQGRGLVPVRPAPPSAPPIAGRLTLKPGTAPPPQMAERIKPVPAKPKPHKATNKHKHSGPQPIERLAAMYPIPFNMHAPLPLALGVTQDIAKALGIHPHAAQAVLARWTSRMNYLAAMAAPGSRRFNLDGTDAGEVSDEHRAHAAAIFAEKMTAVLAGPATA